MASASQLACFPDSLLDAAAACRAAGRPGEALDQLNDALARLDPAVANGGHPGNARAWLLKGQALTDLDRVEEAVVAFARACVLAPNDPDSHLGLAYALAHTGRADEALGHLDAVLATGG